MCTIPDANPNENYCILETGIIESMSNHLQEKDPLWYPEIGESQK